MLSAEKSLEALVDLIYRKGIPITDSHFWQDEEACTLDTLRNVFRSCTDEEMPMLEERLACLREAGTVLYEVRMSTSLYFSPSLVGGMTMFHASLRFVFRRSDA